MPYPPKPRFFCGHLALTLVLYDTATIWPHGFTPPEKPVEALSC
jgi:hypothetical protein